MPAFTSSASRLLASDQAEYSALESLLRSLYGREVLIFNSGYHANVGAIASLADDGHTLIVADKLVHASIIDGARLSGAPMERFRHNDMVHLERILARRANGFDRVLIVTESVFSMDGDTAPIDDIIAIKRHYPQALLYVDEAHAFGVKGPQGLGLCQGRSEVDFIVGTLGKAAASVGAFIVTSGDCRDYLLNRARSFVFSTAIPPVNCAWSRFLIGKIVDMDAERRHLAELGELLRGFTGAPEASHIQPLITGSAASALALSDRLRDAGFKVLAIRTPTVPPGTERLRFSLSAALSTNDLRRLNETAISL